MGSFVFIHMRNIQCLCIEMLRDCRNLSAPIINDIFRQKDISRYTLKQISKFSRPLVKSVYHKNEGVLFLGLKVWDIMTAKVLII